MSDLASRQRQAVAHLYHTVFTGLILTVVTRRSAGDAARWIEALFRTQHEAKFLSSFEKLGLSDMPPAVAAAAYHYHSNRIGGVDVEFMRESDRKAWVRFPPPRWIYPGASICGIPSEVSRGMLRGWYARNGTSMGVAGLQFVCTGQTVDAQAGLMGYFIEHDAPVAADARLVFRPGEVAPLFDPEQAPRLPDGMWPAERLEKARRNYAMEYLRTGLPLLFSMFGVAEALHLSRTAGWLVGVQLARAIAEMVGADGSGPAGVADVIEALMTGEGDSPERRSEGTGIVLSRESSRFLQGLGEQPPEMYQGWSSIYAGIAAGCDRFLDLRALHYHDGRNIYHINLLLSPIN
ncbi:MAG: hypothetical protein AAGD13_22665 [Pseudomonadota bacterium]